MKARLRTGPALARLATSTADISRYAPLRYQPVHENAEGWVVARPDDVAAALSSAALTVGTADEPSGAARRLQAQMARFTDGPAHQRRRELVQELLPDPAGLERDARSMTSAELATPAGEERAVAAVSILFQAHDATAGLIGLALSAAAGHPQATAADLVRLAERGDPPVQCTRRVAAKPVTIGGVTIPAGALVWVLLAAADRGDPWPPATFGGGPHGCPARMAATALARGVVGAILDGGWHPVPGQPVGYEPRPNLRIPVSVLLERS
jgi:cytochrome P450